MAKKSVTARNKKREKLINLFAEKRKKIVSIIRDKKTSFEERVNAYDALSKKLPRDSARNRYRNRCCVTSRGRSVYRCLSMSRIAIRQHALMGLIPGLKKVSL